jgi:hypothetical protein
MFAGIIPEKLSRDFTHPLGNSNGFKRLVAYAKCNRFSHESELMLFVFFILFCYGTSKI